MKEFCRKGHMKGSGKRWLAILMSVCLIGTMIPISARAETDGTQKSGYEQEEENTPVLKNSTQGSNSEPGDNPAPSDGEITCTCSELCTEDHLNSDCPVCGKEGAGLSQCEGKEQTKPGEEQTKPEEKQNAECTCSELCTEDHVSTDCPVCGADDADLYDCKGKADENDEVKDEESIIITAWEWIDEEEIFDPETGSLALPFANKEHPAYFDDVISFLPTQILATVENTEDTEAEEEDEPITLGDWTCEEYPKEGAYTGSYTFTASLPEGYALSEEAEALTVLVELGGAQMYESINNVTGERYSTQISLSYDGEFGFTAVLSINMDAKNAGLYANLFYYNEKTGELEFICADEIAADGTTELVFTHASDYAVVIDTEPMDKGADEADGDKAEASETGNDSTQSGDGSTQNAAEAADSAWNPLWLIIVGAVVIVIGLGVFVVRKKKKSEDE